MIGIIIFGLIFFSVLYGVVYVAAYLPTRWIVKTEKLKNVRRLISAIGALLIISFYLFISPTSNNHTATIEKHKEIFLVTLTGERLLMAHDPISLLRRSTYTETFQLIIPRDKGEIDGSEIATEKGYYEMKGTLIIDGQKLKIDLYYDNYDDKIKDPLSWNGNYELK